MSSLINWLRKNRTSSRLGFALQLTVRLMANLMTLLWTRVLLSIMGEKLYGIFLAFQGVAALGGLGDLGMGGAVAIKAGRYLGEGDESELQKFLASARAVFLSLALLAATVLACLSPWLPGWLGFKTTADSGSLQVLFSLCAPAAAFLIISSYVTNLNYAAANLVWPVLPGFFLGQITILMHCWLASLDQPLWVQYLPYPLGAMIGIQLGWMFLKMANPELARLRPLNWNWRDWVSLMEKSFWMYLFALGNFVYSTVGVLVVNAGFGPEQVPVFRLNYKVCELALNLIVSAAFAGLPKITQWLASPDAATRQRGLAETDRLNRFQTLFACVAGLVYLGINDLFMKIWLGEGMRAPLSWQVAFAATMVITASSQTVVELLARTSDRGLRTTGILLAITAAVNLGLSLAAMKARSIFGITLAPLIAQSFLALAISRITCQHLKLGWAQWFWRSFLIPLVVIAIAAGLRFKMPFDSMRNILLVSLSYLGLVILCAQMLGINRTFISHELDQVRSLLNRK